MLTNTNRQMLALTKADALKFAGIAALLELPSNPFEIANYLAGRKVRGNLEGTHTQALAQYLNGRTSWEWYTSAHTAVAVVDGVTVELVLPTGCQFFAMKWQGGEFPSMIGKPSEGTVGPVSVHQIVDAAHRYNGPSTFDRKG